MEITKLFTTAFIQICFTTNVCCCRKYRKWIVYAAVGKSDAADRTSHDGRQLYMPWEHGIET